MEFPSSSSSPSTFHVLSIIESIVKETEKDTEKEPEIEIDTRSICSVPILHPIPPPPLPIFLEKKYSDEDSQTIHETDISSSIKKIQLPSCIKKLPKPSSRSVNSSNSLFGKENENEKKKEKRVVTQKKQWVYTEEDYHQQKQLQLLEQLISPLQVYSINVSSVRIDAKEKCLSQEIHKKLYGYKSQDMAKHLWDETKFISFQQCVELLIESRLSCFYCKHSVLVLYESVREPTQWSLERIDNAYGHNYDNVEIACLKCNISRRTMYHERYVFTKQLLNIQKIS